MNAAQITLNASTVRTILFGDSMIRTYLDGIVALLADCERLGIAPDAVAILGRIDVIRTALNANKQIIETMVAYAERDLELMAQEAENRERAELERAERARAAVEDGWRTEEDVYRELVGLGHTFHNRTLATGGRFAVTLYEREAA